MVMKKQGEQMHAQKEAPFLKLFFVIIELKLGSILIYVKMEKKTPKPSGLELKKDKIT